MFTRRSLIGMVAALGSFWALFSSVVAVSLIRDGASAQQVTFAVLFVGAFMSSSAMLAFLVAAWARRG